MRTMQRFVRLKKKGQLALIVALIVFIAIAANQYRYYNNKLNSASAQKAELHKELERENATNTTQLKVITPSPRLAKGDNSNAPAS